MHNHLRLYSYLLYISVSAAYRQHMTDNATIVSYILKSCISPVPGSTVSGGGGVGVPSSAGGSSGAAPRTVAGSHTPATKSASKTSVAARQQTAAG